LGSAEGALRDALGEQTIRIFGIPGDTPLAYLMVHADRHMKRLALGLEPMPRGTANYLDMVQQYIERGPPDGQLLRLWFTAASMKVRTSSDQRVFQLGGRPMKLASQTELAGMHGERLAADDDIRLIEFVNAFNKNLDEVIRTYPAYGALQSVYTAAAVAEVLRRYSDKVVALREFEQRAEAAGLPYTAFETQATASASRPRSRTRTARATSPSRRTATFSSGRRTRAGSSRGTTRASPARRAPAAAPPRDGRACRSSTPRTRRLRGS
jgi:hypothetical protein